MISDILQTSPVPLLPPEEYAYCLRNDFQSFVERTFYELNPQTTLMPGWYIERMTMALDQAFRRSKKRLIINIQPRHLKSISASIALPAFILGHRPSAEIICASYGQALADDLARGCRTVMEAAWYKAIFSTRLGIRALSDFKTTEGGGRLSTSVGGVLTGRGADYIIIDDPLKPDEGLSDPLRKGVNDWYDNSLLSRLNNKAEGVIIIVMQRLHQDDLVGHVLAQEGWEVISLPAIARGDETHVIDGFFGRKIVLRLGGEALSRHEPLSELAKQRAAIGEYNFSAQYLQNPIPLGGAIVKKDWLRFYQPHERPERFSRIVQSWDTANKATEIADYSVCTTWGVNGKDYYLLDVFRQRLEYPDLKRAIIAQQERYDRATVVIEDKASGTQLIQDLQRDHLFGVVGYKPPPQTDKIMRLHAQTAKFENGFVRLPASANWLSDYILELMGFPGSKNDDQVDSTSQALDYLSLDNSLEIWNRLGEG